MGRLKPKPATHLAGEKDALVKFIHPGGHRFPNDALAPIAKFFKEHSR